MKMKLLASSLLMAGAMMASGTASAFVFASGTVSQWQAGTMTLFGGATQVAGVITDDDQDMNFTWGSLSGDLAGLEADVVVTLDEVEVGLIDYYDVGFDFSGIGDEGGFTGASGGINYSLTIVPGTDESITSAAFDTAVLGSGSSATAELGSPLFLTMLSTNGERDPAQGDYYFPAKSSITVQDTFTTNGAGLYDDAHNYFDVTVPEPMTLIMMGIGLVGLGYSRRNSKGLSA